MPYLFRKMRQETFNGKRFSKFFMYVIGEIILVVIGILLALQVDNWNEERKTRTEEQTLLKGLKKEMTDNSTQLIKVISYNKRSQEAAQKLLEIFPVDYRQFKSNVLDSLLAEVQWTWTFNPRLGILNSIKSNGKIEAIQNLSIEEFITSFEEMANDSEEESLIIRSIIVDKYALLVSKYVSLKLRAKYLGYPISDSKFKSDYASLFNDREVESLLSYIYIWREDEKQELNKLHAIILKNIAIVENDIIK